MSETRRWWVGRAVVAMLLSAAAVETVAAATVNVMVTNAANGAALDGVTVCIGTAANRASQGRRTTANGRVTFDNVPTGSWVITAWRSTFTTGQTSLTVQNANSVFNPGIVLSATSTSATDPCAATATPYPEVRHDGRMIQPVASAATPSAPAQQRYTASGKEAVAVASNNGFTFSTTTPCLIASDSIAESPSSWLVRMSVGLFQPAGVCVTTVFAGRALAAGWTFTGLRWRILGPSSDCRITATPSLPAARIFTQVFAKGSVCHFMLETVELLGPAGASWQDAFKK